MEKKRGTKSGCRIMASGAALLAGFVLLGTPLGAADSIAIASVERAARTGSPVLAAARERARSVLVAAEAAGLRGDPELGLWVRNILPEVTHSADRPVGVEVEIIQPVRWPGKRGALEAIAAAATHAALYDVTVVELQLVGDLRKAFAELYAADREQRTLADAHELLELLRATANARYGVTEGEALTVLEAELAQDEHDQEIDLVFSRFQAARAQVAGLAGVTPESLPLRVAELPEPVFTVREGPMPFDSQAPTVQAAALRLATAQRRLEAGRLELKPDFRAGGGVAWPEGANPELVFRFGMELPFLRHRRLGPEVAAMEASVAAAQADIAAAEFAGRAEATRLGAERDRLERSIARLAGAIVPRSSVALDAARVGFLNDEVLFSRLLDLFNDWFHARIELSNAEAARYSIWAEAQALAGVPLPELQPEPQP